MIEFLLSEDVERLLAESDSHNMPVRASLREAYPQYRLPSNAYTEKLEDYDAIAKVMDQAVKIAEEVLGG